MQHKEEISMETQLIYTKVLQQFQEENTTRKQHLRKSFLKKEEREEGEKKNVRESVGFLLECTKSINQMLKEENNNSRMHCFVRPNRRTIGSQHRPAAAAQCLHIVKETHYRIH